MLQDVQMQHDLTASVAEVLVRGSVFMNGLQCLLKGIQY